MHFAESVPNLVAIECFEWIDLLLEHPLEMRNRMAVVLDRPGFGVEFKPEAIREYEVKD